MIKTLLAGMLLRLSSGSNDVKGLTAQVDSASSYLITGKIRNYNNEWIYLGHNDNLKRGMRIDSTKVINGEFSFSGEISGIAPFILGIHDKDNKGKIRPSIIFKGPLILSPGHLLIGGEFDGRSQLTAFGTKAQDEYNAFSKKIDPLQKKITNILGARNGTKTSDSKRLDSLNTRYRLVGNQIRDAVKAHVIQFPNSLVSSYIAKLNMENADATTIKSVYDPLTSTVKESVYGIALLQMLQLNELTGIGRVLPSFNIPDLKGQLVSLEDYKGSYMVDLVEWNILI